MASFAVVQVHADIAPRGKSLTTYAIGDIQGCYQELQALLQVIDYSGSRDTLYLLGDLVNRGPDSLSILRWAYAQGDAVRVVLGNHDLHLLAVAAGVSAIKSADTFQAVLQAHDCVQLLEWLRAQPLIRRDSGCLFVHAGLYPAWSPEQAVQLAAEAMAALRESGSEGFRALYGDQPGNWSDALSGWSRHRFVVNACTRMRFVKDDGALDLRYKGEREHAPAGLRPWFEVPRRFPAETVVFGHWSALGLLSRPDVIALDTGCVWGRTLTAISLPSRVVHAVPSQQPVRLGLE